MVDRYGRKIEYLRLSITELCNLRCKYCMPEEGIVKKAHEKMLTQEEMLLAVRAAAGLGIRKVRITGGEPLVKKNIIPICTGISQVKGIEELCLTTNGVLLSDFAKKLRQAGVSRINISVDTLDEQRYKEITRCGELKDVLKGIEAAIEAQFDKVSINTVLMAGINDDADSVLGLAELSKKYPVDVRFIELMPMLGNKDRELKFVSSDKVKEYLKLNEENKGTSVCKYYSLSGAKGRIGLISPMSHKFCNECNRIRITADGRVKPCLHSSVEYSIKGMNEEEMLNVLKIAIENKPEEHNMSEKTMSGAQRYMNTIGG